MNVREDPEIRFVLIGATFEGGYLRLLIKVR